jgi:hypothetical protein
VAGATIVVVDAPILYQTERWGSTLAEHPLLLSVGSTGAVVTVLCPSIACHDGRRNAAVISVVVAAAGRYPGWWCDGSRSPPASFEPWRMREVLTRPLSSFGLFAHLVGQPVWRPLARN